MKGLPSAPASSETLDQYVERTALLAGGAADGLGVTARNARVPAQHRRSWRWGLVPIAVAYGVLLTALAIGAVQAVSAAFRQLALDKYLGAV